MYLTAKRFLIIYLYCNFSFLEGATVTQQEKNILKIRISISESDSEEVSSTSRSLTTSYLKRFYVIHQIISWSLETLEPKYGIPKSTVTLWTTGISLFSSLAITNKVCVPTSPFYIFITKNTFHDHEVRPNHRSALCFTAAVLH